MSSGEQGFVNFAQDVTGLRENTGDKTREIQFPWEKRFQRSSLFLSRIRCSFRIEGDIEIFYRCWCVRRNASRFDRSKLLLLLLNYRNVSSFLPIFFDNIKPGFFVEGTFAKIREGEKGRIKKEKNGKVRFFTGIIYFSSRNGELRFFGRREKERGLLLGDIGWSRWRRRGVTVEAGPFPKKYPRDRLKLERSSRGVNSLLKRLFLTRNCLKLVYTGTATARQKLIRTLSSRLGPPYEILNAFNFSARLRLFPVDRPFYSPRRWQWGENIYKRKKEREREKACKKHARLKKLIESTFYELRITTNNLEMIMRKGGNNNKSDELTVSSNLFHETSNSPYIFSLFLSPPLEQENRERTEEDLARTDRFRGWLVVMSLIHQSSKTPLLSSPDRVIVGNEKN